MLSLQLTPMLLRLSLFLILLNYVQPAFAQVVIKGLVTDKENGSVLSFVNIGIQNKNIGTTSSVEGNFSLPIPTINETDTLTFSIVGYERLNIPIKNILIEKQSSFRLLAKPVILVATNITADKLKEQTFGIRNSKALIHFTDGSTNQRDIFEIAQLMHLGALPAKITSVNLFINEARADSAVFRINFYGYNGSRPTERICEKSIIQTHAIKEGWLKFDLNAYGIYLKDEVVVGIEFIPSPQKTTPIYYELKLGGSSKSFVRKNSQGEWVVPPHHYRMFITALVDDTKGITRSNELEEKESIPTFTLYSQTVKDTFSLFVHLPKSYDKNKNQQLPVIYLLDANAYFDLVATEIDQRKINIILIGIGYKDFVTMDSLRNRDYTFPKAAPQDSFSISGGGDNFLLFLSNELIPLIEKSYSTDTTSRTLMGHSLGGYFTLYALHQSLLNKQCLFTNYLAASPSLQYSDNYLLKQFQKSTPINKSKQTILITIGEKEDSVEQNDTTNLISFNALISLLSKSSYKNLALKSKIYPNYEHMETAVPSFIKAIEEFK